MDHPKPGAVTTAVTAPGPTMGRAPGRRAVPSARPALVVVGIAAVLVLLFGIGAALTGSSPPSKPAAPATGPVRGTTLRAEAATAALRPIERPGTPPSDVLHSIVLPVGSTAVWSKPWNGGTQFSAKMAFRLPSSQAAVVGFYRTELQARGWSISSVGPARGQKNATEVLAQRASNDGWYWEIGVVVSPTTFSSASGASPGASGPPGASAASAASAASGPDTTRFSLDLFEEPDTG